MDNIDIEILKLIRKVRDRMHSSIIINLTAKSLLISLGFYLMLILLARLFPIYNPYYRGLFLAGGISMFGFIVSLFMPPKNKSAALFLDSLGLSERTITAYELIDDDSNMASMQKKDALCHIKKTNIKKEIKILWPKKLMVWCGLLICIILLSAAIPNPIEDKAIELNKMKQEIKEQKKEVGKITKEVESNNKLTKEQKNEVMEKLIELKIIFKYLKWKLWKREFY